MCSSAAAQGAQIAQVTAIRLKPVDSGIEIILVGAISNYSQVTTDISGNNLIIVRLRGISRDSGNGVAGKGVEFSFS